MKRGAIGLILIWGALSGAACGDRWPSPPGGDGPADWHAGDPSTAGDGGAPLDAAADGAAPSGDDSGTPPGVNPFVHSEEEKLIDGRGQPLLFRSVGLGNWLLPEGYMWK